MWVPVMNGVCPSMCDGLGAFLQEACLEKKGRLCGHLSTFPFSSSEKLLISSLIEVGFIFFA